MNFADATIKIEKKNYFLKSTLFPFCVVPFEVEPSYNEFIKFKEAVSYEHR